MDPLQAFLLASAAEIAFCVLVLAAESSHRRRQRRLAGAETLEFGLAESSKRLGLDLKRDRGGRRLRLSGRIAGSRVTVEFLWREEGTWATTVTLVPRLPLAHDIWFQSRWSTSALDEPPAAHSDLDTGDTVFDKLIAVGGRASTLRALLNAGARSVLVACARRGPLRLRDGTLEQKVTEVSWSTERLKAYLGETLAAARVLGDVRDVVAALAENAQRDPEPGVRARCLIALLSEHPADARTAATLEATLSDESDSVRLLAATALGERGVPILVEIATREDGDEGPAARAIATLGPRLPTDRVLAILDSAIPRGRRIVALAAIGALARAGDPAALDRLAALLRGADEECAVAAARSLGQTRSPAQEAPLLDALDSESPSVQRAVVQALAGVGGVACLARLLELTADPRTEPELVRDVRATLAAVHARLPDAAPGQVSLADSDVGHLSLVDTGDRGRVSLSPDSDVKPGPRQATHTAHSS